MSSPLDEVELTRLRGHCPAERLNSKYKEARHAVALVEWGLPRQTTGADRRRILAGPFELAITRSDGTAEVPEPQGLCRRQVMFVLPPGVVMGRRSR